MGLIRVLLALAVVIGHSAPLFGFSPITPGAAVQSFYMISGFYMSVVLSSKYDRTRQGTLLFYQNRYLRLMPTYLTVFVLTLVSALLIGRTSYMTISDFGRAASGMKWSTLLYLAGINIFIFGQDTAMFTAVSASGGGLEFCSDYMLAPLAAYKFLMVPQAWSIGVELAFYAIAPWLLRARTRIVVLILASSLLLRFVLYAHGLQKDPWTYRFFPCELAMFLAGTLAHRAYDRFRHKFGVPRLQKLALGWTVAAILLFQQLNISDGVKYPIFFVLFASALPSIFELTKKNRLDGITGELSYPIYVCHLLVLRACGWAGTSRGLLACFLSVGTAAVLVKVVERPVDRFRQRRAEVLQGDNALADESKQKSRLASA